MSKNNDILSQIGGMYILYKLRWVIIIGIIILTIIVFSVKGDLKSRSSLWKTKRVSTIWIYWI